MSGPDSLLAARETEHKVEPDSGFLLDRKTGEVTPWDGLRILWRFRGERKWRRQVVIADPEQSQTVASLRAQVPEMVAVLAQKAEESA